MAPRLILLRRPARLSVLEEPFVPEGGAEVRRAVDARWAERRAANPACFDGRLWHVLGVHRNGCGGAVLHVQECAYRYFAVQDERFDLGVRPLGVKGITVRGGRVLLGRRAGWVFGYPGRWEFAPGGVVEPDRSPEKTVLAELDEETGVVSVRPPTPIALLYDGELRCWELVFRIEAAPADALSPSTMSAPPSDEYTELAWHDPAELPSNLTPVAKQMVRLARAAGAVTPGPGPGRT